ARNATVSALSGMFRISRSPWFVHDRCRNVAAARGCRNRPRPHRFNDAPYSPTGTYKTLRKTCRGATGAHGNGGRLPVERAGWGGGWGRLRADVVAGGGTCRYGSWALGPRFEPLELGAREGTLARRFGAVFRRGPQQLACLVDRAFLQLVFAEIEIGIALHP